ncbi:hypothetical protein BKL49_08415 [Rodentibacter myodis]|uniref:Uncharacterized protein n=2 Tax=Rodentibacter myodis TaxID=1907939 RepID=A0A1V3JM34_9PAST|nr:hypothetical protein [Rodentibacter myodis]OOF57724.1 hypothetical protein BKL49_08415 [Rodentibacter myodis]
MWDLFKRPINKDSLESWVKILDDIAKVAILAMPVIVYGEKSILFKITNVILLVVTTYLLLFISNVLRKNKQSLTEEK